MIKSNKTIEMELASFWIHPDTVPLSTKIVCKLQISGQPTNVISIPITDYARMFTQERTPVVQEVLNDMSKPLKLYFEIKSTQEQDIQSALAHLRPHTTSRVVISSYLYEGNMRTRIICSDAATTDRQVMVSIATAGISKGLVFDTNIYNTNTKLQALCSSGERMGIHNVIPSLPPFRPCFVDYVIQAVPTSAKILASPVISHAYKCSGTSFVEEVINAIFFDHIDSVTRSKLEKIMKTYNLQQLYSHKMMTTHDDTKRAFTANDIGRNGDEDSVAYMTLASSQPAKAQQLLDKYGMIVVDGKVKRKVTCPTAASILPTSLSSPPLDEEERKILRDLLTEKIAALTRIRHIL